MERETVITVEKVYKSFKVYLDKGKGTVSKSAQI